MHGEPGGSGSLPAAPSATLSAPPALPIVEKADPAHAGCDVRAGDGVQGGVETPDALLVDRARAGTYRLNVRVDGGEWVAPPGLLDVEDEFGGRVGLLVLS
jgi:hypothetical protein